MTLTEQGARRGLGDPVDGEHGTILMLDAHTTLFERGRATSARENVTTDSARGQWPTVGVGLPSSTRTTRRAAIELVVSAADWLGMSSVSLSKRLPTSAGRPDWSEDVGLPDWPAYDAIESLTWVAAEIGRVGSGPIRSTSDSTGWYRATAVVRPEMSRSLRAVMTGVPTTTQGCVESSADIRSRDSARLRPTLADAVDGRWRRVSGGAGIARGNLTRDVRQLGTSWKCVWCVWSAAGAVSLVGCGRVRRCGQVRVPRRRGRRPRRFEFGEGAGEEPAGGVEHRLFGFVAVEADAVGEGAHGVSADDDTEGVGDAVHVIVSELTAQRLDDDGDVVIAAALAHPDPLLDGGVDLLEPLLEGSLGDAAEGAWLSIM